MLVLVPVAFLSGVLSVFSPCVLPILPVILSSGIDGRMERVRGVIFGLMVSFSVASLLLATAVRALGIPADAFRNFAVVLLVIFGLNMVFPLVLERVQIFFERRWKFTPVKNQNNSFGGGFLTGASLGIVWTPCIGPVLAAVATLAAVNSFSIAIVFIAFAYTLGIGFPLYYIAKGGSGVGVRLGIFRQNSVKMRQVFGVIILLSALFISTGADRAVQSWMLLRFPQSWTRLSPMFEEKINVTKLLQELRSK